MYFVPFLRREVNNPITFNINLLDDLFCGDILSLESLEGGNADVCDEGVQLVGAVLILVAETSQADANPEGNVPAKHEIHLRRRFCTSPIMRAEIYT